MSARAVAACSSLLAALAIVAGGAAACSDDTTVNPIAALGNDAGSASSDGGAGASTDAMTAPALKIDDVIEPLRAASGVPGIAALVFRDGAVVAEGAAGVRKLGDPTPLTVDDTWFLGTTVETMTATLAALVVEDRKLSWASTIGATLPDVVIHASYKDVTFEQLLAHRAGAPAVLPSAIDTAMRMPGTAQARRDEAARSLLATAPEVVPGSTVLHSNAGYLIAASMIERVTGAAWEDLLRTRVFDPLGMTKCRYEPLGAAAGAGIVEPWGHVAKNDVLEPVSPGSAPEPPPAFGPAGRVRCPLRDWSKLAALHLAGALGQPTPIVSAASFLHLQTPVLATQALGWNAVARPWAGDMLALVEASQSPLFLALMWVAPARNVAFLVLLNESDGIAASAADKVVGELIARFAPAP
ncbi:MAG: penicillin-binding protein beta-lactamase class [Myxococcaceae bacterium]|nr:penicillin-binding protein beta-lactamase class [Myxococcaceae bacterium]